MHKHRYSFVRRHGVSTYVFTCTNDLCKQGVRFIDTAEFWGN